MDADEVPELAALASARPLLEAFITLFRGTEAEVLMRLLVLREIGREADSPRWSPEALRARFTYLDPVKLETVLKRLRDNALLAIGEDGHYALSDIGRNAVAAIAMLLRFGEEEDAELGFLTAQLAGLQAVGSITPEALGHLLSKLNDLSWHFEEAIASGSEFRILDARRRLSANGRWLDRGTDILNSLLADPEVDFDIARIEKGYEEPTRNELFFDSERAQGILIAASSGSDIVKVGAAVEKKLAQLKESRLPAGVECHKVFYQPERVGASLGTFVINLIESVIIVVVILMLAMGFKSGIIIGISLIVTVFGSFLFLYTADGTMQRVSLAAFVLAMGMLVDNAIVIVDGILVDLKAGKNRMEAMTAIGRQTAMPLLGATLIAIIAFLPIFLSPDTAGVYTRDLFIVLAVSLLLSWVLALVHVPLMANRKLHPAVEVSATGKREYKGRTYALLRTALYFGLAHRWSVVLAMLALLGLSIFGYGYMRQGFFPDMVYDQLYMEYKLPEGNNSTRVARDLREIESYLKTRKEITHVTASVGGTPGRYNLVRSIANPSLSYGELIIDFTSPDDLVENMDEIQEYLTRRYPDAYINLKRYNLMFKKYPIEAQFMGPDPAVLHRLADSARYIMEHTPEVRLITTDWEPQIPVLSIEYDQAAARALDLSRNDVSMSLLSANGGIPIGFFYEGIHRDNIYLKCLDEEGKPIEDLGNTQVFSALPSLNGLLNEETMVKLKAGTLSKEELVESLMGSTPLKQISKRIDIRWEDPVVPRYNGQRSQRVQCSPAPGIETEKARQIIARRIEQIELPQGYTLHWQGEKSASDESMEYLFKNFPLAIILMIAILIMLFKDYRKPIIIFCSLPMLLVGVVAVMLLTDKKSKMLMLMWVIKKQSI
mgnify:CR=1 FL=1